MKKLISMVDFVLENTEDGPACRTTQKLNRYAKFLKQPIELGMFIPVDERGKILKEPVSTDYYNNAHNDRPCNWEKYNLAVSEYEKAKNKILFLGFVLCDISSKGLCIIHEHDHFLYDILHTKTVEWLTCYNIFISSSAVKQLGL